MRSDKYHGGVPTDRWREIRPLRPGTTHLGRRTIHDPFVAVMMLIAARTGATMMSPQRAGSNAVIGSESGPGSGLTSFQGRSTPAAVLNAGDVSGVGGVLYNTTGDTPGGFFPVPGLTTSATPTTPAGNQYAVASATSNTVTVAGTPWTVNQWQYWPVTIISGTGSGGVQAFVLSNTNNTLTIGNAGLSATTWTTAPLTIQPDNSSTIQLGFDQNYNAVQTAFVLAQGVDNFFPQFMMPPGDFTFPNGLPPLNHVEQLWGNETTLNCPGTYSQPYPFIWGNSGGEFWGLHYMTVNGPGGMSNGNPGTNRVRGVCETVGRLDHCYIAGFFVGVSANSQHTSAMFTLVTNCFYNWAWELYGAQTVGSSAGNNDLHNVHLDGSFFACMMSASGSVTPFFAWRGQDSHMGNAPYCLAACDYIDEVTGLPANFQFQTLSATSTSITVGPTGSLIRFPSGITGMVVHIVSGTSAGSLMTITSASGTTITGSGGWSAGTPDATSIFQLGFQVLSATSTTATFAANSLQTTAFPLGWLSRPQMNCKVIAGTGGASLHRVTASTDHSVTVSSWTIQPDSTTVMQFVRQNPGYQQCQIYDDLASETTHNAVFQEFSNANFVSMVQCNFMMEGGSMADSSAYAGLPHGYVWDFTSATDSVLALEQKGGGGQTAFLRSRQPSTDLQIISDLTFFAGTNNSVPPFDGSSSTNEIVFATDGHALSGVSKKLAGAVVAGEPLEVSIVSGSPTVQKYVGPNGLVIPAGKWSANAAGSVTFTAGTLGWPNGYVNGWTLAITAGTGSGQSRALVTSGSNGDVLAWTSGGAFSPAPDATSVFLLTQPASGGFYGVAAATQTGGVVPAVQQCSVSESDFRAQFFQVKNGGDRLIAQGSTPGYFTSPNQSDSGGNAGLVPGRDDLLNVFATAAVTTQGAHTIEMWQGSRGQIGFTSPAIVTALPTASAQYRGQILTVSGGGTANDVTSICLETSSATFTWVTLATA